MAAANLPQPHQMLAPSPQMEILNRIEFLKQIGKGSFGRVYECRDKMSKVKFAVKIELAGSKVPQLKYEYRVYKELQDKPGFVRCYLFWKDVVSNNLFLAMELKDKSLAQLKPDLTPHDIFTWIGPQAISIVETLHNCMFLHRDIKPENFVVDMTKKQLFLIDFGLSKKYRNEFGEHIPRKENKSLTGTYRYISLHTHAGIEQSRRDDMISLGYVLIYLAKGKLPWQELQPQQKTDPVAIGQCKTETPLSKLCEGIQPLYFYMRRVLAYEFTDAPEYSLLVSILTKTA